MDVWTKAIPELFRNLKALGCVLAECQPRSQGLQGHGAVSTEAACPHPAPPPRGSPAGGTGGSPDGAGSGCWSSHVCPFKGQWQDNTISALPEF